MRFVKSLALATGVLIGGGLATGQAEAATPLLNEGDRGEAVVELQKELHKQGLYNYNIDGIFGDITEAGVKAFQQKQGLVVDGLVGKNTKSALGLSAAPVQAQAQSKQNTSGAKPASVKGTMVMEATAYTAYCAGCSGVTATGIDLRSNPNQKVIAVDPNVIPLGSKVYVEGYGTAIAGDTGGAIKGNRIDLFIPSQSEAINFGRRTVEVQILN